MNNYDYNTLSGLRAAMVELKTAAAAAGLEVAGWYDYGYDNRYSISTNGNIISNVYKEPYWYAKDFIDNLTK